MFAAMVLIRFEITAMDGGIIAISTMPKCRFGMEIDGPRTPSPIKLRSK
jgi:hypothetical protein